MQYPSTNTRKRPASGSITRGAEAPGTTSPAQSASPDKTQAEKAKNEAVDSALYCSAQNLESLVLSNVEHEPASSPGEDHSAIGPYSVSQVLCSLTSNDGQQQANSIATTNDASQTTNISWETGSEGFALEDVDGNTADADSAIAITRPSSTTSALSLVRRFISKNGRTYHSYKVGKYILPNDEQERDRLDLQHHIFLLLLLERLHLAPLPKNIQNTLDIGTGTGIWAIDFADAYPSCYVIGSNLSPIQPKYVPPNLCFEVDDAEDQWVYQQKFDYVHGRCLAMAFEKMESVCQSAYDALVPGGYFELQDVLSLRCSDKSGESTQLMQWQKLVLDAAQQLGCDFDKANKYQSYMKKASFIEICEEQFSLPTNLWAKGEKFKALGLYTNENLKSGIEGISLATLAATGWSTEAISTLLDDVKYDLGNRRIHAYLPMKPQKQTNPAA